MWDQSLVPAEAVSEEAQRAWPPSADLQTLAEALGTYSTFPIRGPRLPELRILSSNWSVTFPHSRGPTISLPPLPVPARSLWGWRRQPFGLIESPNPLSLVTVRGSVSPPLDVQSPHLTLGNSLPCDLHTWGLS